MGLRDIQQALDEVTRGREEQSMGQISQSWVQGGFNRGRQQGIQEEMRKAREELEPKLEAQHRAEALKAAEAQRLAAAKAQQAAEAEAQRQTTAARRAISDALHDILQTRFTAIPEEYRTRMAAADTATLQAWLKQALTATSLESVFGPASTSP